MKLVSVIIKTSHSTLQDWNLKHAMLRVVVDFSFDKMWIPIWKSKISTNLPVNFLFMHRARFCVKKNLCFCWVASIGFWHLKIQNLTLSYSLQHLQLWPRCPHSFCKIVQVSSSSPSITPAHGLLLNIHWILDSPKHIIWHTAAASNRFSSAETSNIQNSQDHKKTKSPALM